jgi:hypothetical protein
MRIGSSYGHCAAMKQSPAAYPQQSTVKLANDRSVLVNAACLNYERVGNAGMLDVSVGNV